MYKKPCPFCGNKDEEEFGIYAYWVREHIFSQGKLYYYKVACSCGAYGSDGSTSEEAIEKWNIRRGE